MHGISGGLPVTERGNIFALLGLAGALTFSLLPIAHWFFRGDSTTDLLLREAIWWLLGLAVLCWLAFVEKLPLTSIGFRYPTWKSIAFGLLAALTVIILMAVQFSIVVRVLHLNPAQALATQQIIMKMPYWFRVLLVLRAAVVEEILFRGYVIEKVRQLSGSNALAVTVSILAFTYGHLRGWGPVQLIPVAASGTVFALLYVWRRDLPSNMLGHFLADAAGFLTR